MKRSTLLLLLSCAVTLAAAKPRFIQFEKELAKARFIGLVVIDRYDEKGKLFFHSTEFADTLNTAQATDQVAARSIPCTYSDQADWTGSWPSGKDTVLIVVDSTQKVSLFAKLKAAHYRFWSPYFTGSIALFSYFPPVLPVPNGRADEKTKGKESCWDGCLLPLKQLAVYRARSFVYRGHALTSGGEALFIWEFADSAAFYLDGVTVWDTRYRDKMIAVTGDLVQEKGKNVLKNWKVLLVE